jgi:hypothetical protein
MRTRPPKFSGSSIPKCSLFLCFGSWGRKQKKQCQTTALSRQMLGSRRTPPWLSEGGPAEGHVAQRANPLSNSQSISETAAIERPFRRGRILIPTSDGHNPNAVHGDPSGRDNLDRGHNTPNTGGRKNTRGRHRTHGPQERRLVASHSPMGHTAAPQDSLVPKLQKPQARPRPLGARQLPEGEPRLRAAAGPPLLAAELPGASDTGRPLWRCLKAPPRSRSWTLPAQTQERDDA